jgi:SAM-dependent methyltransferase
VADIQFRTDLYRGTASYYDRFRPAYPCDLIEDLIRRAGADGTGTLLDLACGTGQLTFALHQNFAQSWAVDQEADMIGMLRAKAQAAGIESIRPVVSAAEDLDVPPQEFDLAVIGNAFHRLRRSAVAADVLRWLRPGRCLALVWGDGPSHGSAPWQQAMAEIMSRWQARLEAADRVPADYERERASRPDSAVLSGAGFRVIGNYQFRAIQDWTPESLTGYVYSTSVLSPPVLGGLASGFEAELRSELLSCEPGGRFRQEVSFAYDLAARPG